MDRPLFFSSQGRVVFLGRGSFPPLQPSIPSLLTTSSASSQRLLTAGTKSSVIEMHVLSLLRIHNIECVFKLLFATGLKKAKAEGFLLCVCLLAATQKSLF